MRAALGVPGCPCKTRAGLGECERAPWHAGAAGTLRGASGAAGAPVKYLLAGASLYGDMPGESQESVMQVPQDPAWPRKCFAQQLCIALAECVPLKLSLSQGVSASVL